MHHVRKRDSDNCQEVKHNTGSRGIYVEKRHTLKGFCKNTNVPEVIVIEDDDGVGEVDNHDNEASLRSRHRHHSSCSGLGDRESSFNTYELSTSSSDEEDCVVIEPYASIRASYADPRSSQAGKRLRLSSDTKDLLSRRRNSPREQSECEIVPDFNGTVKQDWEEAALRRRMEKSTRAESEESTSASVHASNVPWKISKGLDGSAVQTQSKNTAQGQSSRADASSYAKRRKDIALDQQDSNVNICDVGSEASTEQTLLPQNKLTTAKQGSTGNTISLKLRQSELGVKASRRLDDTGSCLMAGKYVKENDAVATADKVPTDREAMKQTDEFRHADKEEWARRHLELQKQAEKAQREKKKRKLDADRQTKMEARQKRRLEEIRQSQLKEELASGFKERVRDRVLSELDLIANTCRDMATLLRRLGVPVEGGTSATDQQVTTAYKKALLCFHPDRAAALAKKDPAYQVEVEEKFKLVSRMKSVLPLVSSGVNR